MVGHPEDNAGDAGKKQYSQDTQSFSTRYPGEESISIDQEDIEYCKAAIEICRTCTLKYIQKVPECVQEKLDDLPQKPTKKSYDQSHG